MKKLIDLKHLLCGLWPCAPCHNIFVFHGN